MTEIEKLTAKSFVSDESETKWSQLNERLDTEFGNVQLMKLVFEKGGIFEESLKSGQDAPYNEMTRVLYSLLSKFKSLLASSTSADHVATVIIGFLNGAKILLGATNAEWDFYSSLGRHLSLIYVLIVRVSCEWSFTLAQKVDKAVRPLSTSFVQALMDSEIDISSLVTELYQHSNCRTFKYTLSIATLLDPASLSKEYEEQIGEAISGTRNAQFGADLLSIPIEIITSMGTNGEATVEDIQAVKKRLKLIAKGALKSRDDFIVFGEIAEKLAIKAQQNKTLQKCLYEIVLTTLDDYLNSPMSSEEVKDHLIYLQTALSPIIPDSISNVDYQNVFYNQFQLVVDSLKTKDSNHRRVALGALERWYESYLEQLARDNQEQLMKSLESLVYLAQDSGDAECRAQSLRVLRELIVKNVNVHPILKGMIEGDSEIFESTDAVNMSRLISDQSTNVRKEFAILLRVCNHSSIKWYYVCSTQRVLSALSTEQNSDVKDILIGLLKYQYFRVKERDDKEAIMASVRGLLDVYEKYGMTTLTAFINSLAESDVDDYNVYASVLRKFGHQIHNSFGEEEDFEIQDNILTSIKIGSLLWHSINPKNFDIELDTVKDCNTIWLDIINKIWKSENAPDEAKIIVLKIAAKFPADTVDQISTKICGAFSRPIKNPAILVQTLVNWEKTGTVWSLVTDWFQDLMQKVKQNDANKRSKRIRFGASVATERLEIGDVLRYLNCLCDYEATFNSAASKYAMESLAEFEVIFMNDIVNQSEDFKKITPLQFRTLVEVKNKLMNHRDHVQHENMTCYFDAMKSFDEQPDHVTKKNLQLIFKHKLIQLGQSINEGNEVITDDIETELTDVLKSCSDALTAIIVDILEFTINLLKFRIYKDTNTSVFIGNISTLTGTILNVIAKAEHFGSLEFPTAQANQLVARLIHLKGSNATKKKIMLLLLDTAVKSLSVSEDDFNQNPSTAVFCVNHIQDSVKDDQSLDLLIKCFDDWVSSHTDQSEEELQKEEYLAAWLVTVLQKTEWNDKQKRRIEKSKMLELGRDFLATSGGTEKSKVFDESAFDNEHSLISNKSTR